MAGSILSEIGYLTSLTEINLSEYWSRHGVSILVFLLHSFSVTNYRLPHSYTLGFNDFAGYIPSEIGLLTSLSVLIVGECFKMLVSSALTVLNLIANIDTTCPLVCSI